MASINNLTSVYADRFYLSSSTGVSEISDTYATKTELGDINTANSSNITANADAISVLNTKQLQNFHDISSISHILATTYQTNLQISSSYYSKVEIDTTFSNYYTSTQIDTNLSTNFQTNTQLATNYYDKGEVDTLIAGAGSGYTTTEVDNLLDLRVPKSDFTNRFSANPIIDCSAPTVIHSGLTLNNSTINISPVAGLLFSNQTGGGDKVLAEFKNATSYITLQGDKIFCNNTSDDAIKQLDLTNNNAGYKMSGKIAVPSGGLVVENTADANLSFTVRNTDNYITFNNDNIDCYNSAGDTGRILNLNNNADQYVKTHSLLVDILAGTLTSGYGLDVANNALIRQNLRVNNDIEILDTNTIFSRYPNATKVNTSLDIRTDQEAMRLVLGGASDGDTNTYLECNNNTRGTTLFTQAYFKDTVNYENADINISNTSGLTIYKNTTDASNVFTVKNAQGYIKFNSFNINAYNTSNDSSSLLLLNTANGNGVYCLSLGIGAIQGANKLNVSGGNANFGGTSSFQNTSTFNGDIYVNNSGRIFQRADANNSLNVISTEEINFSLQTNRTTDPTTGTIALQLNDTNGITINRAVVNNQTFNSIGKITAEADLDVWGGIYFQHSSAIKETLNGSDYDLDIRNGDTDRAINFIIGTIGSTPELQLTEGKVNLLGNLEITHDDITGQQRVLINNPDDNGWIRLSNNNLSTMDATTTGVDVYGDLSYTGSLIPSSDKRLKKDIKEVNSKKAVELVKYIKPKTYHFIDDRQQGKSCVGFIANDFMETKKMPDEWQNVVKEGKDGYLKFDYTTCVPILWSALQTTINEVDKLKKEVNKLKKNKSDSD